mmetsp:Transcript_26593/g.76810  ORF Transcript_26593/g.76810 Transcript_26593/m.76810 type:complete len:230 (+) Transcript_26593:626-1315(+)
MREDIGPGHRPGAVRAVQPAGQCLHPGPARRYQGWWGRSEGARPAHRRGDVGPAGPVHRRGGHGHHRPRVRPPQVRAFALPDAGRVGRRAPAGPAPRRIEGGIPPAIVAPGRRVFLRPGRPPRGAGRPRRGRGHAQAVCGHGAGDQRAGLCRPNARIRRAARECQPPRETIGPDADAATDSSTACEESVRADEVVRLKGLCKDYASARGEGLMIRSCRNSHAFTSVCLS